MATTLKVTAFEISKCGYYKRGNKLPEFGQIDAILKNLTSWINGKTLVETKTTDVDGDSCLPTYCFDLRAGDKSKGYLLTTWNEVPMTAGGVQAASGSAAVGKVKVQFTEIARGDIPGFPSYFYFYPAKNLIFSLRPEGMGHNGHQESIRFMKGFIEKASRFVVANLAAEDVDQEILGYSIDGTAEKIEQLIPQYHSSPKKLPGEEEFLRKNIHRIRKLIKRDFLSVKVEANRSLMSGLLRNVGLMKDEVHFDEMSFKYEIDFSPTKAELEEIIKSYDPNTLDKSETGFKLVGEQEIHWLGHSFAKSEIELDLIADENGILPADQLLYALEKTAFKGLLHMATAES